MGSVRMANFSRVLRSRRDRIYRWWAVRSAEFCHASHGSALGFAGIGKLIRTRRAGASVRRAAKNVGAAVGLGRIYYMVSAVVIWSFAFGYQVLPVTACPRHLLNSQSDIGVVVSKTANLLRYQYTTHRAM